MTVLPAMERDISAFCLDVAWIPCLARLDVMEMFSRHPIIIDRFLLSPQMHGG